MVLARKSLYILLAAICLLMPAVQAYSHNLPVGGSRWRVGKDGIIGNIDLNQGLLSEINGVKESHVDLAAGSAAQLQQIAKELIQPYMDNKLSLTVNGKPCPLKVDKLIRNDNSTFTIWLSASGINLSRPENSLRINYRMLFEETNNTHINLSYFYRSDATGAELQNVFNFSPPDGRFTFESNSPAWDISVKGAAAATTASPAKDASAPVVAPELRRDREHAAGQITAAVLPGPDTPVEHRVKEQVNVQQPPPPPAEVSRNREYPERKDAVYSENAAAKPVSQGERKNPSSIWSGIGSFILLGIEHILTGYDHIAFLIGLIVIGLSFKEVLKIITAFTIAHSITLLLAALQIISLNSRFVESVIALSICYIALENLFRKEVRYRWVITFCFGLVHGFGFASALQELIVGKSNLILSVVSFNFGVETGQLMIFFILLPVMYLLKKKMEFRKVTVGVSVAIFVFGFTWLIERLFDLKLISS